jgi:hypothetical protein
MKKNRWRTRQTLTTALLTAIFLPTLLCLFAPVVLAAPPSGASEGCIQWNMGSVVGVAGAVAFVIILAVLLPMTLRGKNEWLSLALSESEPLRDKDGQLIIKDKDGKLVAATAAGAEGSPVYPRSASRLIAFIGLFSIIIWGMAVMVPALSVFARTGNFPDLGSATKFIVAQAGIFAPYIVNKVAGIFK